jgi:hypothetical protein
MVVPGTSESVACGAHVPGAVTVEIEVIYTVTPPVASVVVEAIMVGSADVEEEAVIEPAELATEVAEVATATLALETAELAADAAEEGASPPPPPDPACPPISAPC